MGFVWLWVGCGVVLFCCSCVCTWTKIEKTYNFKRYLIVNVLPGDPTLPSSIPPHTRRYTDIKFLALPYLTLLSLSSPYSTSAYSPYTLPYSTAPIVFTFYIHLHPTHPCATTPNLFCPALPTHPPRLRALDCSMQCIAALARLARRGPRHARPARHGPHCRGGPRRHVSHHALHACVYVQVHVCM